ncbi:uncharacterized protein LOC112160702 isoform X1 [Oryzias melastigma]|uniref:uncharacterized protein LOC112160702 isoform X1 n=1 Tax=Oryzias melastigma TaxID=30732 RepID=UPI000CF7C11D|nr:uncharacterized protein LOC112160702 isoform X1 [Oryzias melastigma]
METHDQSAVFDPAERRKFDLQVASRSPLKMEEEEVSDLHEALTEVELQTSPASRLSRDHVLEDKTSVGDQAAARLQRDCDGPGEAPELPDHHHEEAPHPPQEQTPTEDDTGTSEKNKQKAFQLVLNELLQQQKHRPGRRFKKKTLMKMAKLLVIAKGLDGEAGPPDPEQDAPVATGGHLLPGYIMETHDQNAGVDSSSVDKDGELEPGGGSDSVPDLQVVSKSALKMEEEETEVELQTSAASRLSGDAVLEDKTSVGDQAAASLQRDCDGPGEAPELPDHHHEEAPHPPQEQTPTEDDTGTSEKNKQKAFQLVLNELLQQQKHRPGRRFKKKTLMKMAKLLVIAKGLDGEAGPPDPEQDAPVATGEDGSAETTAASTEQEDLNFSQEAHGASRTTSTSDQQKCSSSSNREDAVITQNEEEQNPRIFRVLEAHRPRKRMKKASRTSKNKKAEQKPPDEAQSAFCPQTEEEVASAEQDEGVGGHAGTILTAPEVRDGKQLDGAVGKKRKRRNKTKAAQTKPEPETLTSQELPPGGAVLQGRQKLRRRVVNESVPPPKGLLKDPSPAGGPEQIHAARTGKAKKRKRTAALELSVLESSPEKKQSDGVWFGSFTVKQEEEEQQIQTIKKRRGRKRKEVNELQSSELSTNKMAAAADIAEEGQPTAAVQGEPKRRGRKKKIKIELPEKLSEDISNMAAVEKTQEEHEDVKSKTENCEHPASKMKKRRRKQEKSAPNINLNLPETSSPPEDVPETLKKKRRKVSLGSATSDVPLGFCSSPLNLSLPEDPAVKKKKRGRRPKAEKTSQIPQTGLTLESSESNFNVNPPENVKKRRQNLQSHENSQILELKAIKQEFDGSVTPEPLCQNEEWAPPRRKPRKRRGTSGTARRRVKPPQTFSNLVPVDLGEMEEKTVQLSAAGEGAPPTITPEDQELPDQTQSHLCSVCGRSFRHLSVLTIHRLMHAERKPLARPPRRKRSLGPPQLNCPCCAAAFSSKTQLLLHLSNAESCTAPLEAGGQLPSHSDITAFVGHLPTRGRRRRRHSCPTCWRTFRSPAGLSLHRKVHTKVCAATESFQDLDLRLPPETESGLPETESGPPKAMSGPQKTKSRLPKAKSGPQKTKSRLPKAKSGLPETESGLTETESGPPKAKSRLPKTESGLPRTESGPQKTKSRLPKAKSGLPKTKSGPRKTESGPRKTESGPRKTLSRLPKAKSGLPKTDLGLPKTESELPKAKSRLPKTEPGPPKTKSRLPKTEPGPPKTKSRLPKTKSGPPKTMSGPPDTQSGPSERPHSGPYAETATSVLFSCPTCTQLHSHWCIFVLHVRTHATGWCQRCDVCLQQPPQEEEPPQHCPTCCELSGESETCRRLLEAGRVRGELLHPEEQRTRGELEGAPLPSPSPSSSSSAKQVEASRLSPNPKSNQEAGQPFFRPQRIISKRFLSARWGRSFSHWSRQRLHQKPGRAFHCSQCELDFHFLGSYLLHLQEHAAQTLHAFAASPTTSAEEPQLGSQVSECHKRRRCSRCGKPFSSRAKLQKHELLHRGVRAHICTRCQLPFSRSADLTAHLKAHEARLRAPEPAGVPEPLSFPYPCRKCDATFSSGEFLQAHQVRHFTAGKRPESPASYVIRRAPEDPQRGALESSQPPRPLPVSNRKHLFRYPHPDRLYVVLAPPSEPALLISDSEDEIETSAEPGPSLEKPTTPQPVEVSEMDQLDLLIQSLIPERDFSESNSCCEGRAPPLLVSPQEDVVYNCAMCTAVFTELSELHTHYMAHAQRL